MPDGRNIPQSEGLRRQQGSPNLPYLQKTGREINRRLLEVERVSHNSGLSGDSIQRVVQPTVTDNGEKVPALKFGQPRVMALFLALTLFHHLIDGFHNRDLRALVVELLGVTDEQYTTSQMTYDLRRLRLKGLIFRPPKTHRYFLTPYGWKTARLFTRLEARVFLGKDSHSSYTSRQHLHKRFRSSSALTITSFRLRPA